MTLALVAFVAVFLLVASTGLLLFYREAMQQRLSAVVSADSGAPKSKLLRFIEVSSRTSQSVITPFQKVLPRSPEEVSVIQKRLIRAGYRKNSDLNVFYASKVLTPVTLALLSTATGMYNYGPIFVYALAFGLGFLLPDFWLGNRIAARQLKIRLGLPQALDLMVICIEAGLSIDQAMVRVADELQISAPELSDELSLVNLEQRAGRPRADAWRNLAERTDVDTVRALIAMLIQADQFGTSVAKSLRIHSDTLRTQRRQQAEEQANKTTVKLVFPLALFIFPSLFVVALGPSLIAMAESFKKYLLS
jgi:tight adherence protein C